MSKNQQSTNGGKCRFEDTWIDKNLLNNTKVINNVQQTTKNDSTRDLWKHIVLDKNLTLNNFTKFASDLVFLEILALFVPFITMIITKDNYAYYASVMLTMSICIISIYLIIYLLECISKNRNWRYFLNVVHLFMLFGMYLYHIKSFLDLFYFYSDNKHDLV